MLRIELENIWKRLQERFKARRKTDTDPDDPDHPILRESIQPTTDADELLKEHKAVQGITPTVTGAAQVVVYTIPDGKRTKVLLWRFEHVSGVVTFNAILLKDVSENISAIYDSIGASVATHTNITMNSPTLEEGDQIIINVDGYTSDAVLRTKLWVIEEDAF